MKLNKLFWMAVGVALICLFMVHTARADSLVYGSGSGTGTVGPGTQYRFPWWATTTTLGDASPPVYFDASGHLMVAGNRVLTTVDVATDNSTANNYLKKDASGNVIDASNNVAGGLVTSPATNVITDTSGQYTMVTADVNSYGKQYNNRGYDTALDSSPMVVSGVAMTLNSGFIFSEMKTAASKNLGLRDASGNAYYKDPSANSLAGPFKNIYTKNGIPKRIWAVNVISDPASTTGGLAWLVSFITIDGAVDSKFYGSN
jgi:hypothetical protein